MSRLLVFCLFVLTLLSTGCISQSPPYYSYQPVPYRDYTLKTIHHQPKNDGYVTVTPLN